MTIASASSATPSVDEAFKKKRIFSSVVIMVYPPSNLGVCRFNQIQSDTNVQPKGFVLFVIVMYPPSNLGDC